MSARPKIPMNPNSTESGGNLGVVVVYLVNSFCGKAARIASVARGAIPSSSTTQKNFVMTAPGFLGEEGEAGRAGGGEAGRAAPRKGAAGRPGDTARCARSWRRPLARVALWDASLHLEMASVKSAIAARSASSMKEG